MANAKGIKNTAASVKQRLYNKAKADKRPFQEILQYYAMDRFLYRLSLSKYAGKYVLKGAFLLRVWELPLARPTMDIDLLGRTSNDEQQVLSQIKEVLTLSCCDGLDFAPDTLQIERITEEADYHGLRVRFIALLGPARVILQLDIGFGDVVFPKPIKAHLPCLLDMPQATLLCDSKESAIAEKFEVMVKLSQVNSRRKDFFDIWLLSRQYDFDSLTLMEAVKRTFENRGTALAKRTSIFSHSFASLKQTQWTAFLKRFETENTPKEFATIVGDIERFLEPISTNLSLGSNLKAFWVAPGPWQFMS